jgi:putative Mg2+ transporter-C (MgtC) family protein
MDTTTLRPVLAAFWSGPELMTNLLVFLNLLGALVLGSLVGYERAYHGRAAGMRTYGLVCMASAGLTVIAGFPGLWFGGGHQLVATPDPTRVIQGIVTGIGFLGAGVIVKDGLTISGLTTAASIWAASCIGVLVGVGFYGAAILLAALSSATMMWGSRVENRLPTRHALGVTLKTSADDALGIDPLDAFLHTLGYELARGSLSLARSDDGRSEWRFVAVAVASGRAAAMDDLARRLHALPGVCSVSLAHARN